MARSFNISTNPFSRTTINRNVFLQLRCLPISGVEIYSNKVHFDPSNHRQRDDVVQWCREAGWNIVSLHLSECPFDAEQVSARREAVARAVEQAQAAVQMGCSYVVCHPGSDVRQDREEQLELATESFSELVRNIIGLPLRLAIENTHPHHIGGVTADMQRLLRDMPAEKVGWCFDTGHAHMGREGCEGFLEQFRAYLVAVHLHDNPGPERYEDSHLPPGMGTIDWDILMPKLLSVFDGPIILESSHWNMGMDWREFTKRVCEFIARWKKS